MHIHPTDRNSVTFPANLVNCINCGTAVFVAEDFAKQYFLSRSVQCKYCRQEMDWWKAVLRSIQDCPPHNYDAFAVLGLRANKRVFKLVPNDYIEILPGEIAPPDSNIINVLYRRRDPSLISLEYYDEAPNRYSIPDKIILYTSPLIREDPDGVRELAVFVWSVPKGDDQAWQMLYQAFEAYTYERYESAVIPANVAVELTMTHLLTEFLENVASKGPVRSFLQDAATYSHQLKVLLPALISFTGAPRLPDHIYKALKTLNTYRNKVAHRGKLDPVPSRAEIAKCLCAAAFGFHYLRLVQPLLMRQPSP